MLGTVILGCLIAWLIIKSAPVLIMIAGVAIVLLVAVYLFAEYPVFAWGSLILCVAFIILHNIGAAERRRKERQKPIETKERTKEEEEAFRDLMGLNRVTRNNPYSSPKYPKNP